MAPSDRPAASIAFALDGFGRMRATTLLGQTATITATYDALGRQLTLNDPDKGNWTYVNNALGQVVSQTDAKGNLTTSTFDRLGRPLTRTTAGGGVTETAGFYYYDTGSLSGKPNTVAKGTQGWIGAPEREEVVATGAGGYQPPLNPITQTPDPVTNLHYYDNKGRPSLELAKSDGKWFYTTTSYDTYSRPSGVRHYWKTAGDGTAAVQPYVWEDFGYVYAYDAKSYLLSLTDSLGRDWWSAPTYDYLDRVTSVKKGNGYTTTRTYRPEDGVLTAIATGSLQNMGFGFDGLGNLRSRTDAAVSGGTESFGYDNLNRLTAAGNTGTVGYLANGNIQAKNDVVGVASGTYTYDSTHPHAVASAFGFAMTYDPNGNLLTRTKAGDQSGVTWTGFDKPRTMWRVTPSAAVGSEFHYNASRSRVMQLEFDDVSGTFPAQTPSHYNRKRVYALGSTLELNYNNAVTSGSGTNWKLDVVRIYVPGPDGIIGAREFKLAPITGATSEKTFVYHYDHLGSITAISDWGATGGYSVATGNKAGRYSEDAWGQRRDPLDWNGAVPAGADDGGFDSLTPRGFTGHEMLDDLGLVHMNGRIYDPLLGRFLSADILVQAPANLQAYNRYSYVFNNPLSYTDPSGFLTKEEEEKQKRKAAEEAEAAARRVRIDQRGAAGVIKSLTEQIHGGNSAVAANVVSSVTQKTDNKPAQPNSPAPRPSVPDGTVNEKKSPSNESKAPNNTAQTFDDRFKGMTGGLTVQQSIDLYKSQTGKTLTPGQVEKLFGDSSHARTVLMEDESLHKNYRNILNTNAPETRPQPGDTGWQKLNVFQSIFHNPWYNPWQNSKYISADGHREAVYDRSGNLIRSDDYKGTFNFFGPAQAGDHWAADVEPYKKWGN